ncbi:MAG: hypothetical protein ABI947_12030 [Chloroflexota bacterium]
MRTLDEQQRATLLDRLYRRIGKLDDNNLIQLEAMTRVAESGQSIVVAPAATLPSKSKPASKPEPNQVSRRYFLMTLVAGGLLTAGIGSAAVLALGDEGTRHWLGEQGWLPTETLPPPSVTPGPTPIPTLPVEARNQIAQLQNQLIALTTERDTLNQQLTGTTQQLTALQSSNDHAQGLLDLYNQLESTNLDEIVAGALAALGIPILAIETVRTALSAGVVLAVRILQSIEEQMPLIAAGIDWLNDQVALLSTSIQSLQQALQVSANTPVAKAVTDFISSVLDLLPFGIGQDVKTALKAMGEVVAKLPDFLNNVSVRLIGPARAWIVSGGEGGLHDLLLRPMREQVLSPAQQMVANAENLNSVYNSQLAQPAQNALDQRARIRIEITKKAQALRG